MFNIQPVKQTEAELFQRLALDSCRYMVPLAEEDSTIIALGCSQLGLPVGLALGRIFPEQGTARLQSLFVMPMLRGKGLGSALFQEFEKEALEKGCKKVEALYLSTMPTRPALEHLLEKLDWESPVVASRTYEVQFPAALTGNLAEAPEWLQLQAKLPERMEFRDWHSLTEAEKSDLLKLLENDRRYYEAVKPTFKDYEPLNSLCLLYGGEIAGWQLTYRIDEDTIGYGNFFVRADVRKAGGLYFLINEVVRRQVLGGVLNMHFSVGVGREGLSRFMESFTAPYSPKIITNYITSKNLPVPEPHFETLTQLLDWRALRDPEKRAFLFLEDGEREGASLTYLELAQKAKKVAGLLQQRGAAGERVLLCFPQGLDYILGFFGCLYAGAIAVCAYPPDLRRAGRSLPRLEAIIKDAQAGFALSSSDLIEELKRFSGHNERNTETEWLSLEDALEENDAYTTSFVKGEDIAFLMYTSWSTGNPRGVIVNHRAALNNMELFPGFTTRSPTGFVSWAPFYHDLGLFFGILHPLRWGVQAVLMDPLAFIQRPARWLEAISKYKASATGAPNFAYELCARKVSPAERAKLDLSGWTMALNGAEPVRAETLQRFTEIFSACGFKAEYHYPSFGMAEATCSVSGADDWQEPKIFAARRASLELNIAEEAGEVEESFKFVGCGKSLYRQEIAIVNPETGERCPESHIGEIWLKGPALGQGYWNRPEETSETFHASISGENEGFYLRTGDLGFLKEGELFVTGRLKDLLIMRGRNYYPQDLELSLELSHPAFRAGCAIAFSIERDGEEKPVLVGEVNPETVNDFEQIWRAARAIIAEYYDLELHGLVLLKPGSLPKTSSGKLQRRACRELYLDGGLNSIKEWRAGEETILQVGENDTLPENEPIAIIGMSCRYPGANNLSDFWDLLVSGKDAISEVPEWRWNPAEFFDPTNQEPGKMYSRWGGFIPDLDKFDPLFFGISPREAFHLDPRQRLTLETSWEALEDAGIVPESLSGSRTGVFVANLTADFGTILFDDLTRIEAFSGAGTANSILANRLSYFLDLHGPSLVVDTACSGSLVAVHLACQSLRSGESELALAGGVNVLLGPGSNLFFSKAEALAADGRCKPFDANADGIVRSEGAGMLVLKPLSKALQDNDRIYAVIRGSAVNSDGRSKGIMAPNPAAQETVLRQAYRNAGIDPAQVQYIEAHGTGTKLGDPVEAKALGNVLGKGRNSGKIIKIGSLKSNIGHTEAAAGVGGIIKVALALRQRLLPPSLHIRQPNPLIPFEELRLQVQTAPGEWPDSTQKLVAGISSFGFGGTNAHVVLEEAPQIIQKAEAHRHTFLLTLSARSEASLRALAASYRDLLTNTDYDLTDICYTAARRRGHYPTRLALTGKNGVEISESLAAYLSGQHSIGLAVGNARGAKLAFIFSGQGSHWAGMGLELMEKELVFRQILEECDKLTSHLAGWSLLELLREPEESRRLNQTDYTQPAIFAIQAGLAALWLSWGLQPEVIVGQSLGEIAAAYTAGVLTLQEGMRVAIERSRLMKQVEGQGKTALVSLSMEKANELVQDYKGLVGVAGSTSPGSCVLSGDPQTLQKILNLLEVQGIFGRMLPGVDVAFHSPQMEPLVPKLVDTLKDLRPAKARYPLFSTVTTGRINGTELDAGYWGRNLREPFRVEEVIRKLVQEGFDCLLEISPHPVLSPSLAQTYRSAGKEALVLPSLRRQEDSQEVLLSGLGALHTRGIEVNWENLYPQGRVVSLPTYRWQREKYWFTQLKSGGVAFDYFTGKTAPNMISLLADGDSKAPDARGEHPLAQERVEMAHDPATNLWQSRISAKSPDYLQDHRAQGLAIMPGAGYVEMAVWAAKQLYGDKAGGLKSVEFMQALPLPEQGKRQLQLSVTGTIFKIFSRPDNSGAPWSLHCQGQILLDVSKSPEFNQTLHEIQENCPEQPDATEHYQGMRERGLEYGSSFQSVKNIYRGDDTALVKLVLPPDLEKDFTRYLLHPVLLDGAFQAVSQAQRGDNERYLPVGFEVLEIFAPFEDILWCYVKLQPREASEFVAADLLIFNTQEKIVARVEGLRLKRVKKPAVRPEQLANLFYEMEWEQLPEIDKAANPEGAWLVFENDAGTGEQLSAMLEKSGVQIMRVRKGESYSHHGEIFIINPGNPEHLKKLWESFSPDNCPDGILYLCDRELNGVENLRSVLYLTQVLTSLNWPKMPRLWLVTSGAFEFQTPVSENSLTQRDLWAFGGVLVNEYPRLRCTRIDLSDKPDEHELTGLLKEIAANRADNQLAIRADSSFALRFKRSQMPMELAEESLLNPDTSPVVRPDATYLITGGLGGLGLLLAQRLVELGTRYLALVSRREPDSQVMNTLAELEKQGAIVKIYRYDVSRDEQVLELLKQIEEELPPLRGIVHAAATLEDSLLSDMTLEKVQKVFAAKAQGSWWLHKHSQNLPLDFFVLFSSAAAILGNPGQSNYAAANGFLDGLAQYRRTLGLPATSLNWGPWSGAGMAAQIENNSRFEQGGIYSLTPQQGLAAFELVLRRAPAQLAIFAADWETLSQSNGLFLESGLASKLVDRRKQLAAVEVLETLRSNLSKVGENDRVSLIETYLSQVIMRTLGIGVERLDLKLSLYGIGLDSLTAVEIKNRVETDLQLVVPLENLLQGPSISQLSEELAQQLAKL